MCNQCVDKETIENSVYVINNSTLEGMDFAWYSYDEMNRVYHEKASIVERITN